MIKRLFTILIVLAPAIVFAQEREQSITSVEARSKVKKLEANVALEKKELDELQPTDVGDALTKIPGISLKNYGGLGGLKTFSYRGIGSEHNTVLEDGFVLSNAQIGQVNLGNQMVTNLESISFGRNTQNQLLPVSAHLSATTLQLTTRFNEITNPKLKLQAQLKLGSFGQIEPNLALTKKWKLWSFGGYSRYLHFKGAYDYQLDFGDYSYSGVRKNNELTNISNGATLQFTPDSNHQHRLFVHHQNIDQGLPSAVILFNDSPNEFLTQRQSQFNYDYHLQKKKYSARIYASYQQYFTCYNDQSFQNATGSLTNNYRLYTFTAGVVQRRKLKDSWMLDYGLEFVYNRLNRETRYSVDSSFVEKPVYRNQLPLFAQLVRSGEVSRFTFKIATQFLEEERVGNKWVNLPTLAANYALLSKNERWSFFLNSSYTHRLPSFSELYLGSNYNSDLKNEDAFQNSIDLARNFNSERHELRLQVGIYWNKIWNKLVATPNKNLFQWTILNVGQVHAFGDEIQLNYQWRLDAASRWRIELSGSYNNQLALDADPQSINFGQQIAYVPFQTITADWSLRYKASGLRFDFFWSDFRYALNQNTEANLLPGFQFIDVALFHKIRTKNDHFIRIQASVKNLLNESYYFVRSYPMPGINYLISLSYEF